MTRNRWTYILLAAVSFSIFLSGCGGIQVARKIERHTAAGSYEEALAVIEKEKKAHYSGANSLLYYFDRGALLQRVEDFKTSSSELEQAEFLMEEFATTSVTEAAASMLINDMSLSYSGEDFEQVMVNVLGALNYFYAGDLQGAAVEARKVNTRLVQLNDKYAGKAIYKEDAFARYLAAYAHEASRDYNSAYIDYKKAYKAFKWYRKKYGMPIPSYIKHDLVRLSRWMGFDDQYRHWRKTFGKSIPKPGRRPKKQSEVLFVVYDGLIPTKKTTYITTSIVTPDNKPYALKVAFPAFNPRSPVVDQVRVGTADGKVYESQLMEPLSAIAYKNLEQRIGLISVKAIARATAKYIAAYQVRQATKTDDAGVNMLVGLATNIFTYATEQADTRSWRTLPNQFHVIRVPLPAGEHDVEIRIVGHGGTVRDGYSKHVKLKKGQKKVVPIYVPQ